MHLLELMFEALISPMLFTFALLSFEDMTRMREAH